MARAERCRLAGRNNHYGRRLRVSQRVAVLVWHGTVTDEEVLQQIACNRVRCEQRMRLARRSRYRWPLKGVSHVPETVRVTRIRHAGIANLKLIGAKIYFDSEPWHTSHTVTLCIQTR